MKWVSVVAMVAWINAACLSAEPAALRSLAAVHALNNPQAAHRLPVDLEATVIYYRDYEHTMFVQDGDLAVYVQSNSTYKVEPGDRIRVVGTTRESFRPFIVSDSVRVLRHEALPPPVRASFDDLIHARLDCRRITLAGRVLSADIVLGSERRSTSIRLLTDGGSADVVLDSDVPSVLPALIDAEVEVTGAVSGRFDGKMQMTGIVLHAQTMADVRVIKPAPMSPWALPVTPMDEIVSQFRQRNQSRRVRVQGTITYYMPGSAAVLQDGSRSLWINTQTRADLKAGEQADATGFPDVQDGFLRLSDGEIQGSRVAVPLRPISVAMRDLTASHHVFDLVSIEGEVVAEVREGGQDEYVIQSEGRLFAAIFRHPAQIGLHAIPPPAMKKIAPGSKVRVTGICILEDSNPFNVEVPFDLLMRSYDDVSVVARPSLISVENLLKVAFFLIVAVLAVSAWGWMLRRKVSVQTTALATRIEAEAATERHNAKIEQQRSRILEDINGSRPLAQVLEDITVFVSFQLNGAPCWCEVNDGARLGQSQDCQAGSCVIREEISARSGPPLGTLYAALQDGMEPHGEQHHALIGGARLATLAIETRRLYSDLVHRSEFDLLTEIHNRFSLDKELDRLISAARDNAAIFGLIYVDLDEFKQVNDLYGHRVGDEYLQEVAARMKRQLRGADLLARLGGDEFAAVVPTVRNRSGVEEIAQRLEHCFDAPFHMNGYQLRGTASVGIAVYPEDGRTKDSLLAAADAAMYVGKHTRKNPHETEAGQALQRPVELD